MPLSSAIFGPVYHSRVDTCSSQKIFIFVLLQHGWVSQTDFALTGETFGQIIKVIASRQSAGHKLPKIGVSLANASLEKTEFSPEIWGSVAIREFFTKNQEWLVDRNLVV
jgi:hypothetical protein